MHVVMVVTVLNIYMTTGYETVIWPAALCATAATFGIALGAFLRIRNKEEKSLSLGYFISGIVGGVTEPALYGIGLKYKKPLIALMIGGAVGGLYVGLTLANGAEILIHEGLDTVGLNGQGFELYVKEGDKVRKGQKLIRFDKKLLAEKGLDATTVFLLTNSDEYPDAKFETGMKAEAGTTVVLKF